MTGPVISGVYTGKTGPDTVTVNWMTDEASSAQVQYGMTTAYGFTTQLDTALATSHVQSIAGLSPSTLYHYRVLSKDAAGNTTTSPDFTFTTTAPADTTPPALANIQVVNITASSATVTWTTDEASTTQVEFGSSGNYTASTALDSLLETVHSVQITGLQSFTNYNFRVVSTDKSGNTAVSAGSTFTTSNLAPVVSSFTVSPATGMAPLLVQFSASMTDSDGSITGYEWDFDGDGVYEYSSVSSSATHTYQVAGTYSARVRARDNGGAYAVSNPESVTVSTAVNKPPIIVSILGTVSQNGSSTSVTFNVSASDPNGVIVKFEWDFDGNGTIDATTTSAPAQYTYTAPGEYTPVVKVTDNQGATATSMTTVDVTEASVTPDAAVGGASSGSVGGCFIATAAFGSYLEPEVMVLRSFRDNVLLTNPIGASFVDLYYRVSPPVADFIARHETLKVATRYSLTPIVYGLKHPALAGSFAMLITGIAVFRRINRKRRF
ncbi:MAG: PKD domain-containing protein [Deltaproteobacteria bacterium]|nr:PKD domain-containing protein [Deltaproteobacteria bacterium]